MNKFIMDDVPSKLLQLFYFKNLPSLLKKTMFHFNSNWPN
jgi:hypothetical protein